MKRGGRKHENLFEKGVVRTLRSSKEKLDSLQHRKRYAI